MTIRKIKESLRHNGLFEAAAVSCPALWKSPCQDLASRPRTAKVDSEYRKLNRRPSTLKGGIWTIFNWNFLITGSKLYRLQYSDELQVPQVDIDFEELMALLLDRGAVPDVESLLMLRFPRLWMPTGTDLLLSPNA